MIHLDTNALIYRPQWAKQGHPVVERIAAGEPAAACAIVWYEFMLGPLAPDEADLACAFVQSRIVPIADQDAELAARLFNATGRKRQHKTDTLIAACAIQAQAEFVTACGSDSQPLVTHGLRLIAA